MIARVSEVVEVLGENGLQCGKIISTSLREIMGGVLTVPYPHLLTCRIRWDSALTETEPARTAAAAAMVFKENIV